jgi:hypothetical protein
MKKNKNYNDIIDDLFLDIDLPTDDDIRYETKGAKLSLVHKGRIHSEETKSKWSKIKIGHKRDKKSVKKSIEGSKQTKWLQLLEKYPLKNILIAQKNNSNHQFNTCAELGISYNSYKKLCIHYNIETKKSNYEKTEFARTKQSTAILVWKCSKREPYRPIGKATEYYSISECIRIFKNKKDIKLHKGNLLRNEKNNTPYNNYFFKKSKK